MLYKFKIDRHRKKQQTVAMSVVINTIVFVLLNYCLQNVCVNRVYCSFSVIDEFCYGIIHKEWPPS